MSRLLQESLLSCRLAWFFLLPLLFCFAVEAEDEARIPLPSSNVPIVDQRLYRESENGCGPASLLNLLKFSSEEYRAAYRGLLGQGDETKMRLVIDRYFRNRRSQINRTQNRWGVHGVISEDLLAGLNELLEESEVEALRGSYLDRKEGESDEEMIERVHRILARSIERGVAPILSLRSFRVTAREDKDPGWEANRHHNAVVIAVSPIRSGLGFSAEVLDPWGGVKRNVFLHCEPSKQPFRALRGTEDSGKWLSGSPFLQAVAPRMSSLRPRDLEWSERLVVLANYAIGDF